MENLSVGRIVWYVLSKLDADFITRNRTGDARGNDPRAGDVVPAIVVLPHNNEDSTFTGQAFLDGNDTLWLTSVRFSAVKGAQGTWHWPARV